MIQVDTTSSQYYGPMPDTEGDVSRYEQAYEDKYPNKPTPTLSPHDMAMAAVHTFRQTGITVPDDLAIAQAQLETHLGTQGINAENNPFNIGVYDKKTVFFPKSQMQGDQAYYNVMANHYLDKSTEAQLLQNFVNDQGKRYASDPNYEKKLRKQIKTTDYRMADD